MKALDWLNYLQTEADQNNKRLFRVTELANVSRQTPQVLQVQLGRLVKRGLLARYSSGIYGLPDATNVEDLVNTMDPEAYITGMFALYRHNLITQVPSTEITCFTARRHNLSRRRTTPLGTVVFVYVSRTIYEKPVTGSMASPEQALCDFIHLTQRQGLNPSSLVTFRHVERLRKSSLKSISARYSSSVRARLAEILKER